MQTFQVEMHLVTSIIKILPFNIFFWTNFFFTGAFTFASITGITPIKKSSVERDKNVAVFLQQYRANQGWGMHTDTGSLKIQVK